jgi:TonB family protein
MYLEFDDRPEAPRIPSVISRREGVLLSLVAHAGALLAILFLPSLLVTRRPEAPAEPPDPHRVIQFVEMAPQVDRLAPPRRPAEDSDQNRQSATRMRAPAPQNDMPMARGNTVERRESPAERAAGPESPAPAPAVAAPEPATNIGNQDPGPVPKQPPAPARGSLGRALENLQQYLHGESFDNPHGGDTDKNADIQFDSQGVDFGPWLRRFKAQIERNWLVPQAAELLKGRVVLQFYVLRNGTITDIRVVQPASVPSLTSSAVNAIRLSNPTTPLPPEYPTDRVLFTVTFHYNELPGP